MDAAVDRLPAEDFDVREADVARLSPFVRHHVNTLSRYSFQLPPGGVCARCARLGRASFGSRAGARSLGL